MNATVLTSPASVVSIASSVSLLAGLLENPWFYAVFSAVTLTVGAAAGTWLSPNDTLEGVLLAVGGGSLLISLAFELFDPAVDTVGQWWAAGSLVLGVVAFGALDIVIDRTLHDPSEEDGWGLWWSVTTDGVPENAAMGALLGIGGHGAVAFLFALVVTNGSQSMMSANNMVENHAHAVTLLAWTATGVVVGASVMLGFWFIPGLSDYWLAAVRAFAGGAILASLAGEIFPDAYEDGGPWITLATAVGFLGSFLLR